MTIRDATRGDAKAIAAVTNHYVRDTAVTFTTLEKTAQVVAEDITARQTQGLPYLVTEADEHILGFATCFAFRSGPGYAHTREHTVLLQPGAEGQGLGRALMSALEHRARAAGVHSLIGGISAENEAGLRFHAAIGFTDAGRIVQGGRKFDRWIDLVLMQKLLSEDRATG